MIKKIKKITKNINVSHFKRLGYKPLKLMMSLMVAWTFLLLLLFYNFHQKVITDLSTTISLSSVKQFSSLYANLFSSSWDDSSGLENLAEKIESSKNQIKEIIVVNKYAGVISPRDRAFEVIDDVSLEKILQRKSESEITHLNRSGQVYTPIVDESKLLLGAIIISFELQSYTNTIHGLGSWFLIALLFILFSALLGYLVCKLILLPWQKLGDVVEDSVNNNEYMDINMPRNYAELDNHVHLYRRLIKKLQR